MVGVFWYVRVRVRGSGFFLSPKSRNFPVLALGTVVRNMFASTMVISFPHASIRDRGKECFLGLHRSRLEALPVIRWEWTKVIFPTFAKRLLFVRQ